MKKLEVGIIGCGAIGSEIAKTCVTLFKNKIELVALYDIEKSKKDRLLRTLKKEIGAKSLDELFDKSELVIEAASAKISRSILEKAIKKAKAVMIMSVGGLIDSQDLLKEAEKKSVKVYLPSGAICGMDGLKGAKISKIKNVTLTTKKPPKGLEGAPYIIENKIDLNSIEDERIIFKGSAREAIKGFPKNVNVAALLCLIGLGKERTSVQIITSPKFTKNTHTVEIEGDFGKITTKTENAPYEKNPKTSKLAALSAIATLKQIVENVKMGT